MKNGITFWLLPCLFLQGKYCRAFNIFGITIFTKCCTLILVIYQPWSIDYHSWQLYVNVCFDFRLICGILMRRLVGVKWKSVWIWLITTYQLSGTSWRYLRCATSSTIHAVLNLTWISLSMWRCEERPCFTLSIWSFHAWASLFSPFSFFIFHQTVGKRYIFTCMSKARQAVWRFSKSPLREG